MLLAGSALLLASCGSPGNYGAGPNQRSGTGIGATVGASRDRSYHVRGGPGYHDHSPHHSGYGRSYGYSPWGGSSFGWNNSGYGVGGWGFWSSTCPRSPALASG